LNGLGFVNFFLVICSSRRQLSQTAEARASKFSMISAAMYWSIDSGGLITAATAATTAARLQAIQRHV
ncbi:MAG: hypothetical protein DME87_13160, partial [Verrucomicrobia bacterium]